MSLSDWRLVEDDGAETNTTVHRGVQFPIRAFDEHSRDIERLLTHACWPPELYQAWVDGAVTSNGFFIMIDTLQRCCQDLVSVRVIKLQMHRRSFRQLAKIIHTHVEHPRLRLIGWKIVHLAKAVNIYQYVPNVEPAAVEDLSQIGRLPRTSGGEGRAPVPAKIILLFSDVYAPVELLSSVVICLVYVI